MAFQNTPTCILREARGLYRKDITVRMFRTLTATCIILLSACATDTAQSIRDQGFCSLTVEFSKHAITATPNGVLISPETLSKLAIEGGQKTLATLTPAETRDYIDGIFAEMKQQNKSKILIFVHGGLNKLTTSSENTHQLLVDVTNVSPDYYPISINWNSDGIDDYSEHLFQIRQGENRPIRGFLTSPLYLIADLGRGVVRAPIDIGDTTYRDIQAILRTQKFGKGNTDVDRKYCALWENYHGNISGGSDRDWGFVSARNALFNAVTWLPQIATVPVIDGLGKPAWDNMIRRTKVLWDRPDPSIINHNPDDVRTAQCPHGVPITAEGMRTKQSAPTAPDNQPVAVMPLFAEQLAKYKKDQPNTEITLIGHSMGVFVLNELIRRYPEIPYQNIVYMAGADSSRNTFDTIIPYLEAHSGAKFYNLTLHPQNEVEESNDWVLPRGSLLVWIDDLFTTPNTHDDRTVGRWDNVIPTYYERQCAGKVDPDVSSRIFIKAFDQDDPIHKHGDFHNNSQDAKQMDMKDNGYRYRLEEAEHKNDDSYTRPVPVANKDGGSQDCQDKAGQKVPCKPLLFFQDEFWDPLKKSNNSLKVNPSLAGACGNILEEADKQTPHAKQIGPDWFWQ